MYPKPSAFFPSRDPALSLSPDFFFSEGKFVFALSNQHGLFGYEIENYMILPVQGGSNGSAISTAII